MEYFRAKTTTDGGSRHSLQKPLLIARRRFNDTFDWDDDVMASRLYRIVGGEYIEVLNDPNTCNDVVIPLSVQDALQWFEDSTTETVVDFQRAFPSNEK
jgi:hypothetical protein